MLRKKGKKRTRWQEYALSHTVNPMVGRNIVKGHYRRIGKIMGLLTVDEVPDYPEEGSPLWHGSVSFVLGVDAKFHMPVSPSWDAWSILMNYEAIMQCKSMLRGVGKGDGFWTGEVSSLHYWKPITEEEISSLPSYLKLNVPPQS